MRFARTRTGHGGTETRRKIPILFFSVSLCLCGFWLSVAFADVGRAQSRPARIISLVPALTEMLFAIGAGPQVVAVSSFDVDPPEVEKLPKVGALLDPDVERILSLRPDLVLVYASQIDLLQQLERAYIEAFRYRHGALTDIMQTIRALGQRTGHAADAERVASDLERRLGEIRARAARQAKPRTMLVFGRERGSLRQIYVSGGRGFLHDMLEAAGGVNVFADIGLESVQVSTEMILARAPEVILELRVSETLDPAALAKEVESWRPLASLPAVKQGRAHILNGRALVVPGPGVATSVERFARVLHPELDPRIHGIHGILSGGSAATPRSGMGGAQSPVVSYIPRIP